MVDAIEKTVETTEAAPVVENDMGVSSAKTDMAAELQKEADATEEEHNSPAIENEAAAVDAPDVTDASMEDEVGEKKELEAEPTPEPVAYVSTDIPAVQEVMDILQEREIPRETSEAIFGKAFASGDLADVDIPALNKTVGEKTAAMMMKTLGVAVAERSATNAADRKAVHELAGGEEIWKKAADYAPSHFSKADQATLNDMFAKGGKSAKLAAQDVIAAYKASDGFSEAATLLTGDTTVVALQPLDRHEYVEALQAEHARRGGARTSALKSIEARREAGRK